MNSKKDFKTLSDIFSGRRFGKTGMHTIAFIKSLPIPQTEKDRLIKCYFDELRIMAYKGADYEFQRTEKSL